MGGRNKVWCFLENIRDPADPKSGCYPDTTWSHRDGRFWSSDACNGLPPLEEEEFVDVRKKRNQGIKVKKIPHKLLLTPFQEEPRSLAEEHPLFQAIREQKLVKSEKSSTEKIPASIVAETITRITRPPTTATTAPSIVFSPTTTTTTTTTTTPTTTPVPSYYDEEPLQDYNDYHYYYNEAEEEEERGSRDFLQGLITLPIINQVQFIYVYAEYKLKRDSL